MKKIFLLLSVVFLVFYTIPSFADDAVGVNTKLIDFEKYSEGTKIVHGRSNGLSDGVFGNFHNCGAGITPLEIVRENDTNNYLRVMFGDDGTGRTAFGVYLPETTITPQPVAPYVDGGISGGIIEISYDLRIVNHSAKIRYWANLSEGWSSEIWPQNTIVSGVTSSEDTISIDGVSSLDAEDFSEWKNVRYVIDLDNYTNSIYVDGETIVENSTSAFGAKNTTARLLTFFVNNASGKGTAIGDAEYNIDNIKIVTPTPMNVLGSELETASENECKSLQKMSVEFSLPVSPDDITKENFVMMKNNTSVSADAFSLKARNELSKYYVDVLFDNLQYNSMYKLIVKKGVRSDTDSKSTLAADYYRDFVTGDSPFAITDIVMSSNGGTIGSVSEATGTLAVAANVKSRYSRDIEYCVFAVVTDNENMMADIDIKSGSVWANSSNSINLVLNIGEIAAEGRKMTLYGYDKFSKNCVLLCNPVNID